MYIFQFKCIYICRIPESLFAFKHLMQQGCSAACKEIDKNHVLQHKNKLLVRFLMLLMIKLLHLHSLRLLCLSTDGAWLPVTAEN